MNIDQKPTSPKSIVVLGGSGLLGQYIVAHLVGLGHRVYATYYQNLPSGAKPWLSGDLSLATWVHMDITSPASVTAVVQDMDVVVHAAALVSFRAGDKEALHQINAAGTALVVNTLLATNRRARLVHISSVAALGKPHITGPKAGWTDEASEWDSGANHTAYGHSKWEAELEVWRGMQEGLDIVILNPALILAYDPSGGSSAALFEYVRKGKPFHTPGTLNYVDVRDVAAYVQWASTTAPIGRRFCLTAGQISYAAFFKLVAAVWGKKGPRYALPPWLAGLAWRVAAFVGLVTGTKPTITRETARTAFRTTKFSGELATQTSNIPYTALNETIMRVVAAYQNFGS